jgi:hypothetical protein
MIPFGERTSTQHMASDLDNVQPAYMVVLEEKVPSTIHRYTRTQAS